MCSACSACVDGVRTSVLTTPLCYVLQLFLELAKGVAREMGRTAVLRYVELFLEQLVDKETFLGLTQSEQMLTPAPGA